MYSQILIYFHGQVLETAREVASFPSSTAPTSYDQVKNQCEALVTGKQQKMLALQSFKLQQEKKAIISIGEKESSVSPLSGTVRKQSPLSFLFYFQENTENVKKQEGITSYLFEYKQQFHHSYIHNLQALNSLRDEQQLENNIDPVQSQSQNQLARCSRDLGQEHSFRLPPSSPYDKFLKAAGC